MNRNPIAIIIILVVVIAGGWYLFSGAPAKESGAEDVSSQMPAGDGTVPETIVENAGATVTYTDAGYSPAEVTIPLGGTVTFVNQSSKNMWVASAMHPDHVVYSGTKLSEHCPDTAGTAFDQCRGDTPGSSYSFTFTKVGEWRYHDHIDATKFGKVIVTAP